MNVTLPWNVLATWQRHTLINYCLIVPFITRKSVAFITLNTYNVEHGIFVLPNNVVAII